jgi:hypothetical protein
VAIAGVVDRHDERIHLASELDIAVIAPSSRNNYLDELLARVHVIALPSMKLFAGLVDHAVSSLAERIERLRSERCSRPADVRFRRRKVVLALAVRLPIACTIDGVTTETNEDVDRFHAILYLK